MPSTRVSFANSSQGRRLPCTGSLRWGSAIVCHQSKVTARIMPPPSDVEDHDGLALRQVDLHVVVGHRLHVQEQLVALGVDLLPACHRLDAESVYRDVE